MSADIGEVKMMLEATKSGDATMEDVESLEHPDETSRWLQVNGGSIIDFNFASTAAGRVIYDERPNPIHC
jgi:hypothetical protein